MGSISKVGWLVLPLLSVACADGSSEGSKATNAASLTQPLDAGLTLGPRFEISPMTLTPGGDITSARLACRASDCFAVWAQGGLVGRVVEPDGTPRGSVLTPFFDAADYTVVGTDQGYVVATAYSGMQIYTVAPDGTTRAPLAGTVGDGWTLQIFGSAASGNTAGILYAYRGATDRVLLRRVRDGVLGESGNGIEVGPLLSMRAAIGAGAGQFAVAVNNTLRRYNALDGSLLDPTPIEFTKYENDQYSYPTLAFDGANHLVAWISADGTLLTTRIRAFDGARLDPDDEFNQLSGGRRICTSALGASQLKLHVVGDRLIYTWRRNDRIESITVNQSPWSSPVGACPGAVLGQAGSVPPMTQPAPWQLATDDIAFAGQTAVRVFRNPDQFGPAGLRIFTYGFASSSPTSTDSGVLNFHGSEWSALLGVASAGADFLVAYIDERKNRMQATRIDDQTGSPLGDRFETTSCKADWVRGGRIASNGSSYLIGWTDSGARCLQRMGCDGELGAIQREDSSSRIGTITSDGNRYLVQDGFDFGTLTRVDKDGISLGAPTTLPNTPYSVAIAADADPDPERRTFMIVQREETAIVARRLRSGTGSLLSPVKLLDVQEPSVSVFAASDGKQILAGWSMLGATQATLLDPVSAQPTASTPISLPFTDSVGASFDGASYVAIGADTVKTKLVRIGSDLSLPDGATGMELQTTVPSVASNKRGRTLHAYLAYDPTRLGFVVYGQFIDNATHPAGAPDVACDLTPGSGGGGNAGGSGGSAGAGQGGFGGGASNGGAGGEAGASTGPSGSGGKVSFGGTSGSSGGASGTSGSANSGGHRSETGGSGPHAGSSSDGGASESGGNSSGSRGGSMAIGDAGETSAGGDSASAGASSSAGGASGFGGRAATSGGKSSSLGGSANAQGGAGNASSGNGNGNGCSCTAVGSRQPSTSWQLSSALVALVSITRRRRTKRRPAS